jgi:hypothetical protein
MFGDVSENNTEVSCAVLLDSLPLVYSSLAEHQTKDDFCATSRGRFRLSSPALKIFSYIKVICVIALGRRRDVGGSSRLV